MLKQSDAVVIFVVLAAVAGIFILSSNTASLVVVAGLAAFFGGLIGNRLRKASASDQDEVAADNVADEQSGQATAQADTKFDNAPAAADVAASEQNASADQANGSTASTAATATARPKSFGDTTAPSQVALLKNLVSSVSEGITFKDPKGHYLSANAAFAQMLGSRPSEIVGRDDAGVFGLLTAKSLLASDDAATAQGRVSTTLEVPLPSGPRFFEITKSSVNNDDDSLESIVAVWRDVTEQALYRIRREKAMSETIMAFTKSIELRDSYLGDHAQRLAQLAAAVTDEMRLDDDVATTVELAAYLSQIGKLGVDAQLLSEQRRFNRTGNQRSAKARPSHRKSAARSGFRPAGRRDIVSNSRASRRHRLPARSQGRRYRAADPHSRGLRCVHCARCTALLSPGDCARSRAGCSGAEPAPLR